MTERPVEERYTYADYAAWDDGRRYELLDGVAYMLAAPSTAHQRVLREVLRQLANHLVGKTCEVFPAPFDVRLNADGKDDTVVQPDISVVCDPAKLDARGCKGAPELVMEILSASTAAADVGRKLEKYMSAGVREYWVINTEARSVQVYLFADGKGTIQVYKGAGAVPVTVLPGCGIEMGLVFPAEEG